MVDRYLDELVRRMRDVKVIKRSRHVPSIFIQAVEEELLLDHQYVRRSPDCHDDKIESSLPVRRIERPVDGVYGSKMFAIGKTKLHITPVGYERDFESAIIIYGIKPRTEEIKGPASSTSFNQAYYAMIHENSVVSFSYVNSLVNFVNSFYPDGKGGFGTYLYPRNSDDVKRFLDMYLPRHTTSLGEKDERLIEVISITIDHSIYTDILMLAIDLQKTADESKHG